MLTSIILKDDYNEGLQAAYPTDWQQRPFDGKVMYNTSGGMPHGRMAIADGALRKADIVYAARASNMPSNSMSYQNLKRRFDEAIEVNRNLEKDNEVLKKDNAVLVRRVNHSDHLIEVILVLLYIFWLEDGRPKDDF